MIKITSNNLETRVYFDVENSAGRIAKNYIIIPKYDDDKDKICIPMMTAVPTSSLPEFTKAIEIAQMIADGTLEVK